MKRQGDKIACLTCYDASFTSVLENAGVEVFIIGDSLGMVIMGHESTASVTMDDMVHHAASVARAGKRAWRIVDLPYRSYETPAQALANAQRLVQEGGAHMVKLEGGTARADIVAHLVQQGIPVCGHVGLLPQTAAQTGGYKVQGRDAAAARAITDDALALQSAGVELLVMECIPATLAHTITAQLAIPTIGIGAGPDCDGQVLVLYDILGIASQKKPRFVKDYLAETGSVAAAVRAYVGEVKVGHYPAAEHVYN